VARLVPSGIFVVASAAVVLALVVASETGAERSYPEEQRPDFAPTEQDPAMIRMIRVEESGTP
jgi:hypothetical protein